MSKKLVLLAFMLLYFSACDNIPTSEEVTMSYMPNLVTITYDSCEYVMGADSYRSVLAHKGN